jgi:tetratricopeptide (TPR) repeat protein
MDTSSGINDVAQSARDEPRARHRRPRRLIWIVIAGVALALLAYVLRESQWARDYRYRNASLGALEDWASTGSRDPLLYFYLGTQYHNAGILPEALSSFQRAGVLDPKLTQAHVGMASVSLKLERLDQAQEAARKAVSLDPGSVDAQLLLALSTYPESKSKALLEFQKLAKLAPKRADAWHWTGRCSRELNDFSGALEPLRTAVRLDPRNGVYYRDLGAVLLDLGKLTEARGELEQALRWIPEDPEANYLLARQLVNTAASDADLKRAEELMARSIQLLGRTDRRNVAAVMVERAEVLRQLKRPKEAIEELQRARVIDPSNTRILHYLGLAARALGDDAEAERHLQEYSRLSRQAKDLSNMEQRVRQDMKNPALRLRMARLYAGAGQLPKAVNQYDMCLYLQPGNAEAKKERQKLVNQAQELARRARSTAKGGGSSDGAEPPNSPPR